MNRLTARPFGLLLLALGLLSLATPFVATADAGAATASAALGALADALATVPELAALTTIAGATATVSGVARLRGRVLSPWESLSVPLVGGLVAGAVLLGSVELPAALFGGGLPERTVLTVFAAVSGGSVAPLVVGAVREHAPVLVAGAVVLLAAAAAAPSPLVALGVGLLGGAASVAGLAAVDGETWRP